jgi:hypothetical protein
VNPILLPGGNATIFPYFWWLLCLFTNALENGIIL